LSLRGHGHRGDGAEHPRRLHFGFLGLDCGRRDREGVPHGRRGYPWVSRRGQMGFAHGGGRRTRLRYGWVAPWRLRRRTPLWRPLRLCSGCM
jgi:hypothetical protein